VLTRATMGEIYAHPGTRALARGIMQEVVEVAQALGATVSVTVDRRLERAGDVGAHKTSMLQDYEAGKPLELDAIVAAVVELADMTGTDTPLLCSVYAATDLLIAKS
jgi:2-dehydropantoate 2-reductase